MKVNFATDRKLIVGEGYSDQRFLEAFCRKHGIGGFQLSSTGQLDGIAGGFDSFGKFLATISQVTNFDLVTDIVLVCDSAEDPDRRFSELCRQIRSARGRGPGDTEVVFVPPNMQNVVSTTQVPRIHVLIVPVGTDGGLETVCLAAASGAVAPGDQTMVHVDVFAGSVCVDWTTEKRDKLRLQAFMSASWERKPGMQFHELFDITQERLVPLDGDVFAEMKEFLRAVAAL